MEDKPLASSSRPSSIQSDPFPPVTDDHLGCRLIGASVGVAGSCILAQEISQRRPALFFAKPRIHTRILLARFVQLARCK
ncbi:hypothetical protein VP01_116g4 [Puccinia sorghi]|uniref:Uncharacterized protein n=1 Tax=Puccinia sorghi TaxID=27349 RepID=A0A0L6VRA6_9BASI|nr:hypothetical protein VP01_116g4 [Puccinia sorghi]